jgi:cytochrome c oxidase subunit IV
MSATDQHAVKEHPVNESAPGHGAHDEPHIPSDRYFIKIALILAVVTALETSTYWWPDGMNSLFGLPFATIALLIMMTIKFFMIVMIFMHLKYDHKIFRMAFYTGLVLAVLVYVGFLCTFQFFSS